MVKDNDISIKRAESGKKGGEKTQFASKFAKAKIKANTENESEYENDNKKKKEYTADFEKFWSLYPNKKDKIEAFKRWQKINIPLEIILETIKKQIEWRNKANGEFRPEWKHPATWLSKGSWEDELKTGGSYGKPINTGQRPFRNERDAKEAEAGAVVERILSEHQAKET
jgi:hypothetical protein